MRLRCLACGFSSWYDPNFCLPFESHSPTHRTPCGCLRLTFSPPPPPLPTRPPPQFFSGKGVGGKTYTKGHGGQKNNSSYWKAIQYLARFKLVKQRDAARALLQAEINSVERPPKRLKIIGEEEKDLMRLATY